MVIDPAIVADARAAMTATRLPASVSIAQYGLESGWGRHMPGGLASNNPFGMKCRIGHEDPRIVAHTREVDRYGHAYYVDAAFRVFSTLSDAFLEHARLLSTAPVYRAAFALLPDVAGFVRAMAPHYATDPHYAATPLTIMDGDRLQRFDA